MREASPSSSLLILEFPDELNEIGWISVKARANFSYKEAFSRPWGMRKWVAFVRFSAPLFFREILIKPFLFICLLLICFKTEEECAKKSIDFNITQFSPNNAKTIVEQKVSSAFDRKVRQQADGAGKGWPLLKVHLGPAVIRIKSS